jgi:hypothetical protein
MFSSSQDCLVSYECFRSVVCIDPAASDSRPGDDNLDGKRDSAENQLVEKRRYREISMTPHKE